MDPGRHPAEFRHGELRLTEEGGVLDALEGGNPHPGDGQSWFCARLLEELDLDGDGVKGVVTPGVKTLAHQLASERDLKEDEHTKFRALAARANYLAADRPDITFAAKLGCDWNGLTAGPW